MPGSYIKALAANHTEVAAPFRKQITNHLAPVHAIAFCKAAALAGGMRTEVSMQLNARWTPNGMTVEYLAKATTDIRAIVDGNAIDWRTKGDKVVPDEVFDANEIKRFTARITRIIKWHERCPAW